MATHATLSLAPVATRRLTFAANERNFWQAAALAAGLVLAFYLAFWLGATVLHCLEQPRRLLGLVTASSDAATRYVTLPHYVIGLLFMLTASRNRNWTRRLLILALLLCSVELCVGYSQLQTLLGGLVQRPGHLLFAVMLYFLIHEFRDQAFFYSVLNAPALKDRARFTWLVRGLIAHMVLGVAVACWPLFVFGWLQVLPLVSPQVPAAVKICLALTPAMFHLLFGYALLRWYARGTHRGVTDVLRTHAPLLRVYAGIFLWMALGYALTSGPGPLILLHVTGWYVFTCHMLKNRSGAGAGAVRGWWAWTRTTVAGFRVLHIGLVLVLIAVGLMWVYPLGQGGWLWYLLSPKMFYHWTIVHITISFVPRGNLP